MTFKELEIGDILELRNGLRFILTTSYDSIEKCVYGKPLCEDMGWEFVFYEHDTDINKLYGKQKEIRRY